MNLDDIQAAIVDLDGTMVDTLCDFVVVLDRGPAKLWLRWSTATS